MTRIWVAYTYVAFIIQIRAVFRWVLAPMLLITCVFCALVPIVAIQCMLFAMPTGRIGQEPTSVRRDTLADGTYIPIIGRALMIISAFTFLAGCVKVPPLHSLIHGLITTVAKMVLSILLGVFVFMLYNIGSIHVVDFSSFSSVASNFILLLGVKLRSKQKGYG